MFTLFNTNDRGQENEVILVPRSYGYARQTSRATYAGGTKHTFDGKLIPDEKLILNKVIILSLDIRIVRNRISHGLQ